MSNALKELSASLREAIKRGAAFTVAIDRDPYPVSGVLIGGDKVLTASHVVADTGADVIMPDGKSVAASLVGRDPIHDLALLKVSGGTAAKPPVGSAAVGDIVVALKRDTYDGINAALGMVSAAGEKLRLGASTVLQRYFQIDADRLIGTTGGPVVDAEGALVGIQVLNRRMGAEVAIPAALALERATLIEKTGGVRRPYLGIRSQVVPLPREARDALGGERETGLLLVTVEAGKAAERAGLMVGDILVDLGGAAITDHASLVAVLAEKGAGATVEARVARGGSLRTVSLTVGEA
ncbi:MAG TPA: trypsin-like peptidase domain-containing protein [Spirochaetia bacterium]